jgi:glycosyltransferase involved in cell wall biosynthesis
VILTYPLVSIVTSTYNHAQYLREAVDSVLSQSYPNIEYLVFNDGSKDQTENILKSYGDKFYWETQENMGEVATLNKAFKQAKGKFIGKLSSDDRLYPDAVERLVEKLDNRSDAVVAFGDFDLINENGKVVKRIYKPEFNAVRAVRDHICYPGTGHLIRREIFEKLGGFDPQFRIVFDMDFWWNAGLEGDFIHIQEPLSGFRIHDQSQSFRGGERMAKETVHMVKKFFAQPDLPAAYQGIKDKAFSSGYYSASQQAKWDHCFGLAFSYLGKAFLINPVHLFRLYGIRSTTKLLFQLFLLTMKENKSGGKK